MTNEEIILKSVQAHLTPAQRHEIAAQITNENTNAERRTFYSFPTWQDAAAALLG